MATCFNFGPISRFFAISFWNFCAVFDLLSKKCLKNKTGILTWNGSFRKSCWSSGSRGSCTFSVSWWPEFSSWCGYVFTVSLLHDGLVAVIMSWRFEGLDIDLILSKPIACGKAVLASSFRPTGLTTALCCNVRSTKLFRSKLAQLSFKVDRPLKKRFIELFPSCCSQTKSVLGLSCLAFRITEHPLLASLSLSPSLFLSLSLLRHSADQDKDFFRQSQLEPFFLSFFCSRRK